MPRAIKKPDSQYAQYTRAVDAAPTHCYHTVRSGAVDCNRSTACYCPYEYSQDGCNDAVEAHHLEPEHLEEELQITDLDTIHADTVLSPEQHARDPTPGMAL